MLVLVLVIVIAPGLTLPYHEALVGTPPRHGGVYSAGGPLVRKPSLATSDCTTEKLSAITSMSGRAAALRRPYRPRMGKDHPTLRIGSGVRSGRGRICTLARNAPHQSNGVRISGRLRAGCGESTEADERLGHGGWGGIRTPGAGEGSHAFQACTIDRSVTHPSGGQTRGSKCTRRNDSSSAS